PLLARAPHGLHAHADADLRGLALLEQADEGNVRAVEDDVGGAVGELDFDVLRGDAHDAEGADGATVADVDPLGGGDPAARAGAARRAVDLPALRAALPAQTALADLAQELGLRAGRGVLVLEVGRRDDALHGVRVAHPRSSGSKHLMSAISPRVS